MFQISIAVILYYYTESLNGKISYCGYYYLAFFMRLETSWMNYNNFFIKKATSIEKSSRTWFIYANFSTMVSQNRFYLSLSLKMPDLGCLLTPLTSKSLNSIIVISWYVVCLRSLFFVYSNIVYTMWLDIFFRQIKSFIRFRLAFVFGL